MKTRTTSSNNTKSPITNSGFKITIPSHKITIMMMVGFSSRIEENKIKMMSQMFMLVTSTKMKTTNTFNTNHNSLLIIINKRFVCLTILANIMAHYM